MTFASKSFLFYFLPIFLIFYFSRKDIRIKNVVFIAFSLLFYSASKPIFLMILAASIGANFLLAIAIDEAKDKRRYRLLALGVTGNLLVLIVFKYTAFIAENANAILESVNVTLPVPHLTLPLGISFYTFHAISYIADVAKQRVGANRRLDEFVLYMSMFPQLVAGPIVRYSTVSGQLHTRRFTPGRFSAGMRIFVIGLSWKLLIADEIAPIADAVFDRTTAPALIEAWLGLYAYAMQIYFDFGGYSAMAVGLGIIAGFTLPRNFRVPYAALSITAFWRRWHISLSAWLRDYVYIPLGGNRGTTLQTYLNLGIVFLLCGLWHGASWTFVIWGAYHGLFLVIERAGLGNYLTRLPREVAHLYTVLVAFLGWVWFRAPDISGAMRMFEGLFGLNGVGSISMQTHIHLSPIPMAILIVAGALSLWKWPRWRGPAGLRNKSFPLAIGDGAFIIALLLLCILAAGAGNFSPFLYYRF
jgi:D-alanyl-lipoteichoic acid acyltransferase DltB (MBOAT superfamily)